MGCTYKAILNKDNRHNKTGKHSIFIRVSLNRKSTYFNLGQKLEEKYWLGKESSWVKPSYPFAFELNAIIRNKLSELQKFEMNQFLFNNPVNLEAIAKFFERKGDKNVFNDYAQQFVKSIKGRSLNTLKLYNTFLKHLNEFNSSITFNQLNEKLFHQFAKWMNEDKHLAGVSVHKYFKPLRLCCKQAVKDGLIEKDPFYGVSISESVKPLKSKRRVYLEMDEITKLKNVSIPEDRPDLHDVLKHWLFCFYAGFYYNDLLQLKWENVKSSELGYCLVAERYKNESSYIAPIHRFKHAVKIIEMQKGKDSKLVFPDAISEQKFNAKLKDLATLANIDKNLMNKTARHSAIQFWEAQGLSTQHVARIVGHKKEATTKNYFELSVRDVNQHVGKFDFSSMDI